MPPTWSVPLPVGKDRRHTIPSEDAGSGCSPEKICTLKKPNSGRLRNVQSSDVALAAGLANDVVVIAGMQLWFNLEADPKFGSGSQ